MNLGQWRILLVDDDPDYGEMMRTALERAGVFVTYHANAIAALEAFALSPESWDALVTDQAMPQMRGVDLVRAIKAIRPHLPCLLCSGDALKFEQSPAKLGVLAVLRKPVRVEQITSLLEGWE